MFCHRSVTNLSRSLVICKVRLGSSLLTWHRSVTNSSRSLVLLCWPGTMFSHMAAKYSSRSLVICKVRLGNCYADLAQNCHKLVTVSSDMQGRTRELLCWTGTMFCHITVKYSSRSLVICKVRLWNWYADLAQNCQILVTVSSDMQSTTRELLGWPGTMFCHRTVSSDMQSTTWELLCRPGTMFCHITVKYSSRSLVISKVQLGNCYADLTLCSAT